ncbi:hypothetical protein [Janthinobacterium sp. BJB401]|uniref:hypothetical protein n=1 Tax=Janthinobacterium sp. BJB401 TaxID=2745934 RepID=UPI001595876A|nr:hypothetical protein [Janthinobacterium sp. BJB401]NVI80383.1 hypothetical protein [Janthinobacterium sp. BJB401]
MNRWYMKPKRFSGKLDLHGQHVFVKFSVELSKKGVAKLTLDRMPWDMSTKFIADAWGEQSKAQRFFDFTLTGEARDGSTFHSTAIIISSLKPFISDTAPATMMPTIWCSECKIILPGILGAIPSVTALLRGFDCIHTVSADCRLGTIELRGPMTLKASEKELLTGALLIQGPPTNVDFDSWRSEVDGLFKHVRSVMSFARGARLVAPIVKTVCNDKTELAVRVVANQANHGSGAFTPFGYAPIFRQAVASHFFETGRAKKIEIAIEWFTMSAEYREAKLTSAMTVLENLLTANLSKTDLTLRNEKLFKQLRNTLLDAARLKLEEFGATKKTIEEEISTMLAKLEDLNRRTLKDKIYILARRWGVPMDGISEKALGNAKRARDLIVHQGQYSPKNQGEDLMVHVRLTRELVVRFVLAALEFEGTYTSPMNGEHGQTFARLQPQLDYLEQKAKV